MLDASLVDVRALHCFGLEAEIQLGFAFEQLHAGLDRLHHAEGEVLKSARVVLDPSNVHRCVEALEVVDTRPDGPS